MRRLLLIAVTFFLGSINSMASEHLFNVLKTDPAVAATREEKIVVDCITQHKLRTSTEQYDFTKSPCTAEDLEAKVQDVIDAKRKEGSCHLHEQSEPVSQGIFISKATNRRESVINAEVVLTYRCPIEN